MCTLQQSPSLNLLILIEASWRKYLKFGAIIQSRLEARITSEVFRKRRWCPSYAIPAKVTVNAKISSANRPYHPYQEKRVFLVIYPQISSRYMTSDEVKKKLTAHIPAILATKPPLMAIDLTPRVLLNKIPLNAPAARLLALSCLPL